MVQFQTGYPVIASKTLTRHADPIVGHDSNVYFDAERWFWPALTLSVRKKYLFSDSFITPLTRRKAKREHLLLLQTHLPPWNVSTQALQRHLPPWKISLQALQRLLPRWNFSLQRLLRRLPRWLIALQERQSLPPTGSLPLQEVTTLLPPWKGSIQ